MESENRFTSVTENEVPFIAIGSDELDTKMVWTACKDCGSKVEFSVGEFLRCGNDENRPRPTCEKCGRALQIGKAVRY